MLGTGILGSLLNQNLLKFAIFYEIFPYFLSFCEFNDHYWPTKLFVFEMGYRFKIFKISVFLFTNNARKLKVAESDQATTSLTKPWLATDEASRSFESNSPDVSRLCFLKREFFELYLKAYPAMFHFVRQIFHFSICLFFDILREMFNFRFVSLFSRCTESAFKQHLKK